MIDISTEYYNIVNSYLRQGSFPDQSHVLTGINKSHQIIMEHLYQTTASWNFITPYIEEDTNEIFVLSPMEGMKIGIGNRTPIQWEIPSELYQLAFELLAFKHLQNWNYKNPFVSFESSYFKRKCRITLIHQSLTPNNLSKAYIRFQTDAPLAIEAFLSPNQDSKIIKELIKSKKNLILCGPTGSGKTECLSSLLTMIPSDEHLIIVEDLFEIKYRNTFSTRLVARGIDNHLELKNFCAYALRASPDRLIVGELRSHEIIPFALAMNTGHKGMLSTLHADGAQEAIERMALLFCLHSESKELDFQMAINLFAKNVDAVLFLQNKKIKSLASILGSDKGRVFFEEISLA